MSFRFLFASPEPLREEHKKLLIYDAKLDGIINTEFTKVALQNKICYESEHHVAGCANEILSDLLSFHNEHSDIIPIWQVYTLKQYILSVRTRSYKLQKS